jgi:hypothetical protein
MTRVNIASRHLRHEANGHGRGRLPRKPTRTHEKVFHTRAARILLKARLPRPFILGMNNVACPFIVIEGASYPLDCERNFDTAEGAMRRLGISSLPVRDGSPGGFNTPTSATLQVDLTKFNPAQLVG